jgi:hypothetical protein
MPGTPSSASRTSGRSGPAAPSSTPPVSVPRGLLLVTPEVLTQQTHDLIGCPDLARRNGHAEHFTLAASGRPSRS